MRIEITTEADRELRRAEAEAGHKPRGPIENLRYTIETETWSADGNDLPVVVGRDTPNPGRAQPVTLRHT